MIRLIRQELFYPSLMVFIPSTISFTLSLSDPPSFWEMVKNETVFEGNSTSTNEFDEASGSLSLNTIGVVKRDRRSDTSLVLMVVNSREGNERDNLFEEWSNLLKVLNISDSNDSISSNNSKSDAEIPQNDILTHHWTLERLL